MTDLSERRDQTAFDLKEIKQQLLDGEIDKATYESLKTLYTSERALLKDSPSTEEETLPTRSRTRFAVGAAILALAIVAITFAASQFAVDRDGGFITGNDVGEQAPVDLDAVTNEQMIAVIESNQDLPQANGMRLALQSDISRHRSTPRRSAGLMKSWPRTPLIWRRVRHLREPHGWCTHLASRTWPSARSTVLSNSMPTTVRPDSSAGSFICRPAALSKPLRI